MRKTDHGQTTTPWHQAGWVGYGLGALGAALFATKGIVIKLALIENVDAVTTLTWRMVIAVPFFALIGWFGYRNQRAKNPGFSVKPIALAKAGAVGLLGYYVASYLDFAGLEYITAQFDRLILMTSPIFVVLLGRLFFNRPLTAPMMGALALSYGGLMVIFIRDLRLEGQNVVVGASLVTGAALAYAFYQLLAKPVIDELGSRLFTSLAMTTAGVAVVIHFLLTHQLTDLIVSPKAMWYMAAMGTISTVFPAYLIAAAIGRIGSGPTAVMGNVSPLVTIVLAVTILREVFSLYHAIGAAMVIAGIFIFTRAEKRAILLKQPPV